MSAKGYMPESKRDDHCTPSVIVDLVRKFGGGRIALDPCSNANSIVNAEIEYRLSRGQDGLRDSWNVDGLVYVNPPYGRGIEAWLKRCSLPSREAIALIPARVSEIWFHDWCWGQADAICFVRGRLKFLGSKQSAPFPSALVYYGNRADEFVDTFAHLGHCAKRTSKKVEKKVDLVRSDDVNSFTASGNAEAREKANEKAIETIEQAIKQGENDMPQLPQEYADEIGKARTSGGGNYIQHGDYTLMILEWFYQQLQDRSIVCKLLVIEAKKKQVIENGKPKDEDPNEIGSDVSEVANLDGAGKLSAKGNSRAVALGLFGFKEGDVNDKTIGDTMMYVCRDNTPAAGMLLTCSTFPKEKRSKPGEFITGRNWGCIQPPPPTGPEDGINGTAAVEARLRALKNDSLSAVRLAVEQLQQFRSGAPITAFGASAGSTLITPPSLPSLPSAPALPPAPPLPKRDPFAGWQQHPQNASYWWNPATGEVKLEADLRNGA